MGYYVGRGFQQLYVDEAGRCWDTAAKKKEYDRETFLPVEHAEISKALINLYNKKINDDIVSEYDKESASQFKCNWCSFVGVSERSLRDHRALIHNRKKKTNKGEI